MSQNSNLAPRHLTFTICTSIFWCPSRSFNTFYVYSQPWSPSLSASHRLAISLLNTSPPQVRTPRTLDKLYLQIHGYWQYHQYNYSQLTTVKTDNCEYCWHTMWHIYRTSWSKQSKLVKQCYWYSFAPHRKSWPMQIESVFFMYVWINEIQYSKHVVNSSLI